MGAGANRLRNKWRPSSISVSTILPVTSPDNVQRLRADAARNRDAIVCAARAAIAEHGPNVALEEVARQAHVGIATLYRRFPNRSDLVAAAFEPKLAAYAAAAREAAEAEDAWEGFSAFVLTACELQADDVGFADVLTLTFPTTPTVERQLQAAMTGIDEVIERAKADGTLRADFVNDDLALLLMANAGVVTATEAGAPGAWRRAAAILLDGLRAPARSELPPPKSSTRLYRAVRSRRRRTRATAGR